MADLSKADKIAAGYKKLKEFQQKSKKLDSKSKKVQGNSNSETNSINTAEKSPKTEETNDSVIRTPQQISPLSNEQTNLPISEEHYPVTNFLNYDKVVYSDSVENAPENASVPSIQSYFNNFQNSDQFDQVFRVVESSKNDAVSSTQNSTPSDLFFQNSANENSDPVKNVKRDNSTDSNPSSTTVGDSYDLYANESPSSMQHNFGDMIFDQPVKKDYDQSGEEVHFNDNFNETLEHIELKPSEDANIYSVDLLDIKKPVEKIENNSKTCNNEFESPRKNDEIHPTVDIQSGPNTSIQTEPFDNSNINPTSSPFIPSAPDQADFSQSPRSTIENIQQLSLGFKNFMGSEDTLTFLQKNQNELEKRNQELAAMLENRNIEVQQLTMRLQEYFSRIQDLETQLRTSQSEITLRVQEELKPLKEQLDYHAQTIGLLVGEKSELTAALEKNQSLINEKIRENEEIQCKLRASRHKVADLEREVSSLKSSFDVRVQSENYESVIDPLKAELIESKKRIDELVEDISELSEKLSSKSQECLGYKQELAEKTNQLSIVELKLHQICNNETSDLELQVETLNKEKLAMELKINHLADELKSLSLEKEKTNEQYQQYVTQLNDQIKSFSSQNEYLTKENQLLKKRENDLTAHISNLEKELQILLKQTSVRQVDPEQITQLQSTIASLEKMLDDKNKEIKILSEEKKDLIKELDERHQHIVQLEERLVDLQNDKPDSIRLVAAMESDKAAAAQAIKQNTKLTKQVEELQDKFVEFTQRELTLTEKLESEQHLGQEILKQLRARENELEIVKQQLIDRDSRIVELERLLEKAINPIQSTIPTTVPAAIPSSNFVEESQNRIIDTNTNSESSALIEKDDEIVCEKCQRNENHLEMSEAMEKLEERFKRTMEDIARLTEERNELEHLVLQLQSETETIGEYVALYQFQRGILKQRTQEKDEELRALNKERAEIKQKLYELNDLIQQIVTDETSKTALVRGYQQYTNQTTEEMASNGHDSSEQFDSEDIQTKRVGKISELISEIYNSNLIEPKQSSSVGHVCSVCFGREVIIV